MPGQRLAFPKFFQCGNVCVGHVTDNANAEADEAGTGGVGSIGFRHSATMHKMVMVFSYLLTVSE